MLTTYVLWVDKCRYLHSTIISNCDLAAEVNSSIDTAACSKLNSNAFCSHDLKLSTKMSVYKADVLPNILYSNETCIIDISTWWTEFTSDVSTETS